MYSTDRVPGAVVLKESPYKIMWTRGNAFYVAPDIILKKHLDALADYCKTFDKKITSLIIKQKLELFGF